VAAERVPAFFSANQNGDYLREADVEYDQSIGSDLIEQMVEQWRSLFSNITFR
jgi:hypothetical protein